MNKKLIALSGCSGGGKSTLLDALKNKGHLVVPEVGREIVKEQLKSNGNITPWQSPAAFCELVIQRSVANYKQFQDMDTLQNQKIFFDRSFLDGICYWQTLGQDDAANYDGIINQLRFYPTIFLTPPWPEIYSQDDERKHSFEAAVLEYERLLKFYAQYHYKTLELPKVSVEKRCRYILSATND